jgi:hypothetical protein
MYQVITMYGDNEPWWFFEEWRITICIGFLELAPTMFIICYSRVKIFKSRGFLNIFEEWQEDIQETATFEDFDAAVAYYEHRWSELQKTNTVKIFKSRGFLNIFLPFFKEPPRFIISIHCYYLIHPVTLTMYGDNEPWWFFEEWQEDIQETATFEDFDAAVAT